MQPVLQHQGHCLLRADPGTHVHGVLHHGAPQGQPHAPPLHGFDGPPSAPREVRPRLPGAHAPREAPSALGPQPASRLGEGYRSSTKLPQASRCGHDDPAPLARRAYPKAFVGNAPLAQVAPPTGQLVLPSQDHRGPPKGQAGVRGHARHEGCHTARDERVAEGAQRDHLVLRGHRPLGGCCQDSGKDGGSCRIGTSRSSIRLPCPDHQRTLYSRRYH
mmetsp:Transcript_16583/g.35732  ORF Transcript_16583/g.35732 Transcript_16583/m.35732 type:complete len:218 (+) Transcript_16583:827-1480(+)